MNKLKPRSARFWKHHISSASERAFPGFLCDIFGCSTLSKKRCFSTQEFTRFLSTVSSQHRTRPFKHSYLIAWPESFLSWHPTHKYLWERLCFVQACCLLSTVTVTLAETRVMSTAALLSKTVSVKILRSAWAPGSRGTKQLETVATRVIAATESIYFARRYWLAGVGGRGSGRRALGGQDSPTWIEISLVFVTIILHVLTYVVSNELFWNWNGVAQFVSQEV